MAYSQLKPPYKSSAGKWPVHQYSQTRGTAGQLLRETMKKAVIHR